MPESYRCSIWFLMCLLVALPLTSGCESGKQAHPNRGAHAGAESAKHADSKETSANAGDQGQDSDDTAGDSDEIFPGMKGPYVRLGTIPEVKLLREVKASPQEASEIKSLIRKLAAIDSPDFGLSGTMSGEAFLPIEGMTESGAMILMNHQLKSAPELRRLVELGPKALPFLLAALDDKTPTKLVMRHEGMFGVMEYTNELSGNPVNPTERKILGPSGRRVGLNGEHVNEHTVKIGDVCLVAIGQIVGRSYQAVRYQPTACVMLNSPTHDSRLCRQVRDIWSSTDAAQRLLDSLLLDYATEGIFNGKSLDGWSIGADLQVAAAMRLLYYFPAESTDLIAERLDKLDVTAHGPGAGSMHTDDEADASMNQCVANGVRAEEFVKATAWCQEPKIRAAMLRIFERATNPDVVLDSMQSLGPDNAGKIRARISQMIDDLADEGGGPFGDGYNVLIALGKYGGVEARPIFQKYLDVRSVVHCRAICHSLRKVRTEWAAELLKPLLADQRQADGWTYAVNPNQNDPRLPIRICDEAAETITLADKRLHFNMRGTHADLDRQIKILQEVLRDQ